MRENFEEHVANLEFQPEVHATLRDVHFTCSTRVFHAGWFALEDHYCPTPQHLEHAREHYKQRRSGWFVGHSPTGVPFVTAVEARAHSLKLVTQRNFEDVHDHDDA